MRIKLPGRLTVVIFLVVLAMLAACASSPGTEDKANTDEMEGGSGTLAMVDSVTVELRDNHHYAVVSGTYPDACTRISSVEQVAEASTISMTLLTGRPEELMCAQMLAPFTIDVLLTTGGLMPQEYTVVVNDGPSTTFALE